MNVDGFEFLEDLVTTGFVDPRLESWLEGGNLVVELRAEAREGHRFKAQYIFQRDLVESARFDLIAEKFGQWREEFGIVRVHLLRNGQAACGRRGPPSDWPRGHRWASENERERVTCPRCTQSAALWARLLSPERRL